MPFLQFPEYINTTPLIESSSGGYCDIVKFLIYNVGCDVNKTDGFDRSPLYWASQEGNTDIVKLLLNKKATVDSERLHCV